MTTDKAKKQSWCFSFCFFFCASASAVVDVGPINNTNWERFTAEREGTERACKAGDDDACVSHALLLLDWWPRVNATTGMLPAGEAAKAKDAPARARLAIDTLCATKKNARACGYSYAFADRDVVDDATMIKALKLAVLACAGGDTATCSAATERMHAWIGWVRPSNIGVGQQMRSKPMLAAARAFFSASCKQTRYGCVELGDMLASRFWGQPVDVGGARIAYVRGCEQGDRRACQRLELYVAVLDTRRDHSIEGLAAARKKACALGHGESCLWRALALDPPADERTGDEIVELFDNYADACRKGVVYACLAHQRLRGRLDQDPDDNVRPTGSMADWPDDVFSFVDDKWLAERCSKDKLAAACAAPCHQMNSLFGTLAGPKEEQEKQCLPHCRAGTGPCRREQKWQEAACEWGTASSCVGLAMTLDEQKQHEGSVKAMQRACALAPNACVDRVSQLMLRGQPKEQTLALVALLEERCTVGKEAHACTKASFPFISGAYVEKDLARALKWQEEACKLGECHPASLDDLKKRVKEQR